MRPQVWDISHLVMVYSSGGLNVKVNAASLCVTPLKDI